MDLGIIPGIFAVVGLVIFTSFVLYYISVSSMKEKTYDEVKAEQKKKAEESLAHGRTAKEKAKDKKLKKAGKKVKEKKSSECIEISSDEADTLKGHVAFVEPPIVEEEPVVIEEKKRINKKKEKPILINKNEITRIAEVPIPIINHFEQIVPKDDFSLKRSISHDEIEVKSVEPQKPLSVKQQKSALTNPVKENKEVKVEKQHAQKQTQPPQKTDEKSINPTKSSEKLVAKPREKSLDKPNPVEEIVVKTVTKQNQNPSPVTGSANASPSTKNSRKKRNEFATTLQQMSGNKDAVNISLIMPLVHKAELSRTDLQVLIDVLLNKQQGLSEDSAEWIEGKQDPVVKLRKQLAEKEKSLDEEQQAGLALQSKLKELRAELNAERHNTRQLEENLTSRQTEVCNLGVRLQHFSDEKQNLVKQIQQLQTQLSEEHMLLCKVQEDQNQAQNVMQQELLAQRQQLELHIARLTEQHQETIAALEGQLGQMSVQLQQQEELRERAHSQDLTQLKELHAEMDRLRSKSQFDTNQLQNEIKSLNEQLNLKRTETDKLNSLVQRLQSENSHLTLKMSSACVEAQQLRNENESLTAQVMTATMERPATEGRENGDLTYPEGKNIDTDKLHEKELLVEQLKDNIISMEKDINRFKNDNVQQESLIISLKNDLDVKISNSEKMLKEITSYKSLIEDHDGVIKALRKEGESAHKLVNTLNEDIEKYKEEITKISQDYVKREQLESRESMIEKLTSELNTHKTELADQTAVIKNLQTELEKYKVETANQQHTDISELERLRTTLGEKDLELKNLQALADHLRGELATFKDAAACLTTERDNIQKQLDVQLQKNDGLRSKNWKAMEALSAAEKKLEMKVKQSEKVVSEKEDQVKLEEREKTKQVLLRLLPNVAVDSEQEYEKWLEEFIECASSNTSRNNNEADMIAKVEQQNHQLQAMVIHYKAIIADTEGMLFSLQRRVEQEEGKWLQRIETLKSQLLAVTQDRDKLKTGSQTVRKRRSFTGWLRHKLRSRSATRRSQFPTNCGGHRSE